MHLSKNTANQYFLIYCLGTIRCSGDSFLGGKVAVIVFFYLFVYF